MTTPHLIEQKSFQTAWLSAVDHLSSVGWSTYNLIVSITQPSQLDAHLHADVGAFCTDRGLKTPKQVAYTIFPDGLYERYHAAEPLFRRYNSAGGLYSRLNHIKRERWGTYFRRLTHYPSAGGSVNQLGKIIQCINSRPNVYKAAYTMVIPEPGRETAMPRGGPCLNYVSVQMDPTTPPTVGLLAVYRNHDFLNRAYGNYWGLSNLLRFVATETGSQTGRLTCVSSHAYVDDHRGDLRTFVVDRL